MFDSPIGGLSSSSKKIQKSNPSPSKTDCSTKKYKTFDNLQKEKVLADLRKGVISLLKIDPHHEALYTQDFLGLLAEIGIDEYNKLIKNIFSQQFENFDLSSKGYTQWRKKIKNWVLNLGKPETRGGLVVPINRVGAFRTRVMEIVQHLPFKCFNVLKEKILVILEEYHYETQDPEDPQPFNNKTCSKHWWFNFMAKNQDIKDMWDALPLTAKAAQLRARAMSSASTHDDTLSIGNLSEAVSPAYYPGFSCSLTEENFWIEPSLKDLSAVYETSEAYLKSLCIAYEDFEEEPHQQRVCSIAMMDDEKVVDSMLSFGEEACCSKNRSSTFALLGDEDKVEFERENDAAGHMFSQLFKTTTSNNQNSLSRAGNFFSLFRTQEI